MRTIEQNFKKNPHTARFLQTFHAAASGLPSDADGENDYLTPAERDLLDEVPVEAPAYQPTSGQVTFMGDMIREICELDATTGQQAKDYTVRMIGHWTKENVSTWIERLIAKRAELRAAAVKATTPPVVADGRYAVPALNGELQFFKVKNGRKAGFVFLDIQASDDWHAIRNVARIRMVLDLIAADPKAAMARYGQEIGECGRCGRTLTSEYRKLGIGPVCIDR